VKTLAFYVPAQDPFFTNEVPLRSTFPLGPHFDPSSTSFRASPPSVVMVSCPFATPPFLVLWGFKNVVGAPSDCHPPFDLAGLTRPLLLMTSLPPPSVPNQRTFFFFLRTGEHSVPVPFCMDSLPPSVNPTASATVWRHCYSRNGNNP